MAETLSLHGLPAEEETLQLYHRINKAEWEALERGETTRARLQHDRWGKLLLALGMDEGMADDMSATFVRQMGTHADLLPGAMTFLRCVKPHMKLALVSNGFAAIQRGRLSRSPITAMMDAIIISEEAGVNKPDPRMALIAMQALGCEDIRQAVFLGDSATADIACASSAGMDSIHLNPEGHFSPDATYGTRSLRETAALLLGSDAPWQEAALAECRDYIAGLFAGESSGHDAQHTLRVERNACRIAESEGGDLFLIRLAALLHDVDDGKLFDTADSLAHARDFMTRQCLTAAEIERVCGIIRTVSFKGGHNAPPESIEGRIVQDADRLDAIGAIGIGRAFAYGGAHGRAMHLPEERPADFATAEAYAASKGTTVNHFYEKLLKLRDLMTTATGRRMAGERHRYMERFLQEFLDEWNGLR